MAEGDDDLRDNANFFKESDGFDCRLEKTSASGTTYIKKNQKHRTIAFTNVKPGTYTAKARAYKLVNGKRFTETGPIRSR